MNKADKNKYYKQKYREGYKSSISPELKTFKFSVLPLWESFIIFGAFAFLFIFPSLYLQKWAGIIIRIYVPLLCFCALGYCRIRSKKLSIEVIDNDKLNCRINNKSLVVLCNENKIFYIRLYKRRTASMIRIKNELFYIYTEDFSKENIKEYDLNIKKLQSVIGNNPNRKPIDWIPFLMLWTIYGTLLICLSFALIFFIALFTDNTHWFDFLKSLL